MNFENGRSLFDLLFPYCALFPLIQSDCSLCSARGNGETNQLKMNEYVAPFMPKPFQTQTKNKITIFILNLKEKQDLFSLLTYTDKIK